MELETDGTLGIRGSGAVLPRLEGARTQVDKLQAVSNYNLLCKALRPAGVGSVIFGLIAIAMGFAAMHENPINALLAIIGIFLLVEGIWILAVPSPVGMIVDGIALLIVGLWNIYVTIGSAGGGISFFALLGVWQIVAGCKSFGRYGHFSKLPMSKPC